MIHLKEKVCNTLSFIEEYETSSRAVSVFFPHSFMLSCRNELKVLYVVCCLTIIFLAVLLHVDLQFAFRCLAIRVTVCKRKR